MKKRVDDEVLKKRIMDYLKANPGSGTTRTRIGFDLQVQHGQVCQAVQELLHDGYLAMYKERQMSHGLSRVRSYVYIHPEAKK